MDQKSWEEGELNWMDLDQEIKSREEGEIGSESREKGDLLPCSSNLTKDAIQSVQRTLAGSVYIFVLNLSCKKCVMSHGYFNTSIEIPS